MTASRPLTDWTDPWPDRPPAARRGRAAADRAPRGARTQARRPTSERARRLRHLRALRRDLLVDAVAAFVVMLIVLIVTAGLGVVALLEIPVFAAIAASFVIERRRRRGRRPTQRR